MSARAGTVAGIVGESRALSADWGPVMLGEFARVLFEADAVDVLDTARQ